MGLTTYPTLHHNYHMSDSKKPFPMPPGFSSPTPTNRTTPPPLPQVPNPYKHLPPFPSDFQLATKMGPDPIRADEADFILKDSLTHENYHNPNVTCFILNYLRVRDIGQAAVESGFTKAQGWHLKNKPDISSAIIRLTEKAFAKGGLDSEEIIKKATEVMNIDLAEFENPDGSYKTHLSQVSPEARRAVKSFKVKNIYSKDLNNMDVVTGQLISVELWDKMKSIEMLGREKGLFKETKVVEHDVGRNMRGLLLESKERAERSVEESRVANLLTVGKKE